MTKEAISEAARAMGRKGGAAKVRKGFASLSAARRDEIARAGAEARWGKRKEPKAN